GGRGGGQLDVQKMLTVAGVEGSPLTIKAANVTLDGATIFAPGANNVAGMVLIAATGNIIAKNNFLIDVSAALSAGLIDLETGGTISYAARATAHGTTRASDTADG